MSGPYAGIVYVDDGQPWVVPTSEISNFKMPYQSTTKYWVKPDSKDTRCLSQQPGSQHVTPGMRRQATIYCIRDTMAEVVDYSMKNRLKRPPLRTLDTCPESSEVDEDDPASQSLLNPKKRSKREANKLVSTKAKLHSQLLQKMDEKMTESKAKESGTSKITQKVAPEIKAQETGTSKISQKVDTEHESRRKERREQKQDEGSKCKKEKKEKAKLKILQGQNEDKVKEKKKIRDPEKDAVTSEAAATFTCEELERADDWFNTFLSDETQPAQAKDESSTINDDEGKKYQMLKIEHDALLSKNTELEREVQRLRELNYSYQEGILAKLTDSLNSGPVATVVSGLAATCSSADVPMEDQPVWAKMNGRVHIGMGLTVSEEEHEHIKFYGTNERLFIRYLAYCIFSKEELLAATVCGRGKGSKKLDVAKLIALQVSLRKYMEIRVPNITERELQEAVHQIPNYLYSAKSDLKKNEVDEKDRKPKKKKCGKKGGQKDETAINDNMEGKVDDEDGMQVEEGYAGDSGGEDRKTQKGKRGKKKGGQQKDETAINDNMEGKVDDEDGMQVEEGYAGDSGGEDRKTQKGKRGKKKAGQQKDETANQNIHEHIDIVDSSQEVNDDKASDIEDGSSSQEVNDDKASDIEDGSTSQEVNDDNKASDIEDGSASDSTVFDP